MLAVAQANERDAARAVSAFSEADRHWMQEALALARRGLYSTHPNPRVGCIIVNDARVVGQGWHIRAGEAHAEIIALQEAGDASRGATVYVTLEPCAHHGRTPPCAEALIAAGVSRVVAAMQDPFARVDGRGFGKLQSAGVTIEYGLLSNEAEALNPGFLKRVRDGRPWVRLKLAASIDGRIATASGESRWITGEAARQDAHRWRARSDVVLTGIGTVLADDPSMTVRGVEGLDRQPTRVILDRDGRTPSFAKILRGPGRVLVFRHGGAEVAVAENILTPLDARGRINIAFVMQALGAREFNEMLVECGSELAGSLIEAGAVDELLIYFAPCLLGSRARPMAVLESISSLSHREEFAITDVALLGKDLRILLRKT
jgi:diaminohydroxyphosphoribosylaminopyrimidine deaminase / 5-amino-6-(5-phosphoribosylamino)uracil reductase